MLCAQLSEYGAVAAAPAAQRNSPLSLYPPRPYTQPDLQRCACLQHATRSRALVHRHLVLRWSNCTALVSHHRWSC